LAPARTSKNTGWKLPPKHGMGRVSRPFAVPANISRIDIIKTFSGDDTETKSQIAFATIVKKILTSDSKNNWVYLLKNLIILDK
jgi:hypothetical protein